MASFSNAYFNFGTDWWLVWNPSCQFFRASTSSLSAHITFGPWPLSVFRAGANTNNCEDNSDHHEDLTGMIREETCPRSLAILRLSCRCLWQRERPTIVATKLHSEWLLWASEPSAGSSWLHPPSFRGFHQAPEVELHGGVLFGDDQNIFKPHRSLRRGFF